MLEGQCASLGKSIHNIGSDDPGSYAEFVLQIPDADLKALASCVSVNGRRMVMTDAVLDRVKFTILSRPHPDDPDDFRGAFLDAFQYVLLQTAPHVCQEQVDRPVVDVVDRVIEPLKRHIVGRRTSRSASAWVPRARGSRKMQ